MQALGREELGKAVGTVAEGSGVGAKAVPVGAAEGLREGLLLEGAPLRVGDMVGVLAHSTPCVGVAGLTITHPGKQTDLPMGARHRPGLTGLRRQPFQGHQEVLLGEAVKPGASLFGVRLVGRRLRGLVTVGRATGMLRGKLVAAHGTVKVTGMVHMAWAPHTTPRDDVAKLTSAMVLGH